MKREKIAILLDEYIEEYLNNIDVELEEAHDRWFDGFGFPIFGKTAKEYHEQVYFQSYLEHYTRRLINGILRKLFYEDAADNITWPEFEYDGTYRRGYTNTECEQKFGFEFINHDTRIGYRYSCFDVDEIEPLLALGHVDCIVIVEWETEDTIIGYKYEDERVRTILLQEMFYEVFCDDLDKEEINTMYGLFTEKIAAAVKLASSKISLQTLPGFTPSYRHKTRDITVAELKKEIIDLTCFYVKNSRFHDTMVNSKQLIEKYKLHQYFLKMGMEQAFVGCKSYAKSYLTSEYLFKFFEKNPMFDYTPIVSGYIKSVEQLLDTLCRGYHKHQYGVELDTHRYTLGDYISYLSNNEMMFRDTLQPVKDIITECLQRYKIESRNKLFHKEYFNKWDRVEKIRKNTIFLYVALLGSVDTVLVSDGERDLGFLCDEYDRLFQLLDKYRDNFFTIVINGKEHPDVRKEGRSKGLAFDGNGLITNTIQFKKLVYDHFETIEISRFKMPSEVWTVSSGKKKNKIWPLE